MAEEEDDAEEDCSAIEALAGARTSASVAVLRDSILALCAAKAIEFSIFEGLLCLSVETAVHNHHLVAEEHPLPASCPATTRMSIGMCLISRGVCLLDFGDLEEAIKSITRIAHGATVSLFLACKVSTKRACA